MKKMEVDQIVKDFEMVADSIGTVAQMKFKVHDEDSKKAFDCLDVNKKGYLERQDFMQSLGLLNIDLLEPSTEEEAEKRDKIVDNLYLQFNKSKDGKFTYDEFKLAFNHMTNHAIAKEITNKYYDPSPLKKFEGAVKLFLDKNVEEKIKENLESKLKENFQSIKESPAMGFEFYGNDIYIDYFILFFFSFMIASPEQVSDETLQQKSLDVKFGLEKIKELLELINSAIKLFEG